MLLLLRLLFGKDEGTLVDSAILHAHHVVAEYFGGPQEGLGSRIASAAANTAYGRAWAYVVASIITGLLFYLIVLAVEKWTTPWTGRTRSV